jgi:hypothetical protein
MLTKKYIVLVLFLVCSAFAEAEIGETSTSDAPADTPSKSIDKPQRIGLLNMEQQKQLALSEAVEPNEVVWLKVKYPEQDELVKVLALEQKPRIAQAQGAVLILHDTEQHADWPYFIRPLRMSLPDAGWDTLSINLPYENVQKIPERSFDVKSSDQVILTDQITSALQVPAARKEEEEQTSEITDDDAATDDTSSEEALASDVADVPVDEGQAKQEGEKVDIDLADKNKAKRVMLSYTERALLHTNAAIDYLKGEGYQNIIIVGYRAGANLALEHIKPNVSQIPKRGFALVMVDPVLKAEYQTAMAEFFGDKFRAPILDIADGTSLESEALARERAVGARIAEIENYHQVSLTVNQSGPFQQSLIRRIRFWLEKYAPGMAATKVSPQR